MQWSTTKAIDLVQGDYVSLVGWGVRKVASTHYAGPANGHGHVTLVFTDAGEVVIAAQGYVRYIAD